MDYEGWKKIVDEMWKESIEMTLFEIDESTMYGDEAWIDKFCEHLEREINP